MTEREEEEEEERPLAAQLALLNIGTDVENRHELTGTPIFTNAVLKRFKGYFTQYGFLAGMSDAHDRSQDLSASQDPRVFFNIAAPSSTFICGVLGLWQESHSILPT